jgi:hypothetical protein
MEALRFYETSVLKRATRYNIQEDGILHSHRREKPQILYSINRLGSVVFPVRYEPGFYTSEDGIIPSHRRENLKSYTHFD